MKSFITHSIMILIVSSFFLTMSGCHLSKTGGDEAKAETKSTIPSESIGKFSGESDRDRFSSPESESLLSSMEELMKLTMELNRQLSTHQWESMDSLVKSHQEEFHSVVDLMSAEEQNHFHVLMRNYVSMRERAMVSDSVHD